MFNFYLIFQYVFAESWYNDTPNSVSSKISILKYIKVSVSSFFEML